MIKLTHSLRNEIYLKLDRSEVSRFLNNVALLISGALKELIIQVEVEPKVLKKKDVISTYTLIFSISDSDSESLEEDGENLLLKLELDSYELLYDLLEGVLEGEEVMPEITDIYVSAWKKEKGLGLVAVI